jgi:hypothetical protein
MKDEDLRTCDLAPGGAGQGGGVVTPARLGNLTDATLDPLGAEGLLDERFEPRMALADQRDGTFVQHDGARVLPGEAAFTHLGEGNDVRH